MIEHYTNLYLDYLNEEIQLPDGSKKKRTRDKYIEAWREFKPLLKWGTEVDLQAAFDEHRRIWVWSDQHFGHKNIIRFSDRPYPTIELMNECMLQNYNVLVGHGDISIWVGDVAFLKDAEANKIVRACNGYKILIIGNHDMQGDTVKKLDFDEIHLVKHLTLKDNQEWFDFMFTHYPIRNIPKPEINIHGHEHVAFLDTKTPQHVNVNCELQNYKPILMQTIIEKVRNAKSDINTEIIKSPKSGSGR